MSARVLLVEDNDVDALWFEHCLRGASNSVSVDVVTTLDAAKDAAMAKSYACIFLDLNLPDSGGIQTVAQMTVDAFSVPVVILTSTRDKEIERTSLASGFHAYLVKGQAKPKDVQHVLKSILGGGNATLQRES